MAELAMGNPDRLATDVGPVIDAEARDNIVGHIEAMRAKGRRVHQAPVPAACAHGTFVPPTVIELDSLSDLTREIFGPVLHVVRWKRTADNAGLTKLVEQINGTGYGLTLGIHTRIDETIAHVVDRAHVGNLYVNRNIVGAVVGVQPFGGEGLSGTGPKAGGPLYLLRLLSTCPQDAMRTAMQLTAGAGTEVDTDARRALLAPFDALTEWARQQSPELAALCERLAAASATGATATLPGPTGERNTYTLLPREAVLCVAADPADWLRQLAAVLAVGSVAVVQENPAIEAVLRGLPAAVQSRVRVVGSTDEAAFDAVLHHGDSDHLRAICEGLARRAGPIVGVQGLPHGGEGLALERLLIERSLSVNTAAAGGNASLMTIG